MNISIQEAVEHIKEHGFDYGWMFGKDEEACRCIEKAIDEGYTFCNIQQVIDDLEAEKPAYNRVIDSSEDPHIKFKIGQISGLNKAIERLKNLLEVKEC